MYKGLYSYMKEAADAPRFPLSYQGIKMLLNKYTVTVTVSIARHFPLSYKGVKMLFSEYDVTVFRLMEPLAALPR
jgi:hypothetical protein